MGHYDRYQHKAKVRREINPIWRGIGCILIFVVLLATFALTTIVVPLLEATGYVPPGLLGHVNFPAWVYRLPVLRGIATFIWGINNLYLGIIVFMVILMLLTGISSLIYVTLLQIIGPPRYSETDAPPSRYKPKPYKR